MRFSALLASGALAVAAAQSTLTTVATPSVSVSPAQASVTACLKTCKSGDVNCQAHCVGVPNPDDSQVNANTKCAAECPQGDGSPAQTDKFAACLAKCSNEHYFTSGGTPQPTGGSGGSGGSGSGASGGSGGSGAAATQSGGAGGSGGSGSGATQTGGSGGSGAAATTSGSGSSPTNSAGGSGSGTGASGGSGSGSGTSTSKGLAPAVTAAPVAILGLVAAVLAL